MSVQSPIYLQALQTLLEAIKDLSPEGLEECHHVVRVLEANLSSRIQSEKFQKKMAGEEGPIIIGDQFLKRSPREISETEKDLTESEYYEKYVDPLPDLPVDPSSASRNEWVKEPAYFGVDEAALEKLLDTFESGLEGVERTD